MRELSLFEASRDFDKYALWIACCYELPPVLVPYEATPVHWVPLDDRPLDLADKNDAVMIANARIASALAVSTLQVFGRPVIISCHLGLNRSALVAGLALRNFAGGERVVKAIRMARGPDSLGNDDFYGLVRDGRLVQAGLVE